MLSSYCLPVAHSIRTRYAENMNYRIPLYTSNRGQKSIKYLGPKVWSQIPKNIKEIAYRKPFSMKIKTFLLTALHEKSRNLPIRTETPPWQVERDAPNDLHTIFNTTSDETFLGFAMSLSEIFQNATCDETFLGFTLSLTEIFQNDSNDSEFFGFDVMSLTNIFNHSDYSEFFGF